MAHAAAFALAESLGLAEPALEASSSSQTTVESLRRFVAANGSVMELAAKVQALSDGAAVADLTGLDRLQQRAARLEQGSDLLDAIAADSSTLASRFKDVSALQTIPVEPEHQADFSRLLRTAAQDGARMKAGLQDLHWGAAFQEPPRVWQEQLAPLAAVQEMCKAYQRQLVAHGEAMQELQAQHAKA